MVHVFVHYSTVPNVLFACPQQGRDENRCMCGAKLTDWLPCMELREKLELEDTVAVLQCKRLQMVVTCYRRMKKSMDYEVKN